MKSELISIIVLVYNTEQYITKCLNSIIKQTYNNLEIIVINDGSTDKSSNKIKRFATKDKRIKVIERNNKGRYLSRLEGYKASKGKYILYVDSDDYILPNTVEVMYNALKENNVDVVRCQYKKLEMDKITIPKSILNRNVLMNVESFEPQFFDLLYKTNYCNTICKQLMKKETMANIDKIDKELNYCEDLACNLEIYKKMKSILFMPDELYVYNITSSYIKKKNNIGEVQEKIEDTIYVYYNLVNSIKEFEIKNRKHYKNFASIKMLEKITILISDLVKTGIKKKDYTSYINNILDDEKVKSILKNVENEDIISICLDMNNMKKKTIKNIELLINKKYNQLYKHNKIFGIIKKH